jgi:hypothetical protein
MPNANATYTRKLSREVQCSMQKKVSELVTMPRQQ